MYGLNIELSLEKYAQFISNTILCIKKVVFFSFHIVYLSFFESETSLNNSTFAPLDFVKKQTFDSNDVNVTSYDVVSLFTRWKLNKIGVNCQLSEYLLSSFNCHNR